MPSNKIRSSRHLAIGKTLSWHRGGAVQRAKETYSRLEKRWIRLIFSIFARTQSDITGQDAALANQISGSANRLLTENNNKQSSSILCYNCSVESDLPSNSWICDSNWTSLIIFHCLTSTSSNCPHIFQLKVVICLQHRFICPKQ